MMQIYLDLFMAMVRSGLVGFGGGLGSVPIIRAEVVDVYEWMSNEEFAEVLALGNTLPGPIATKLAVFIGYKQAGIMGAFAGVVGIVLPTAILIIILAKQYITYKDSPIIAGMMTAVKPVVVILMLQVAFEIGQKSFPNYFNYALAGLSAIAIFYFKIHPGYVILGALVFGALLVR
ncbi:MAG: chromate transporter [Clostridia bacterium]|nr:chromate transporter [Clostridia bacterium]